MSVASTALDIAKFLRERKGIKEEQRRYEQEWPLKEGQIRQGINLAKQHEERERRLWAPGREEKTGFTGVLPYTVKGQEPGLNVQLLQSQLATEKQAQEGYETPAEKRLATGYETPEQRRKAEEANVRRMAALGQKYALELADLRKGTEEEAVPFDESGKFSPQIFANIADNLYQGYTFKAVADNIGLDKVKEE